MSSETKIEFSKENIDEYFNELSKEYKRLGGRKYPTEIIIIGGAAIVENYGFRDTTLDIDAIIPAMGIMKEAINNVGDKHGLQNGWLNNDFIKTSSYSPKLAEYSKYYKTFNQVLEVRCISGEYLIAMKLKSGRTYKKDLSDIIGILAEHERMGSPITFDKITKAINDLYNDIGEINEQLIVYIKDVLENSNFDKEYRYMREKEKNTRNLLIDFEEKYPGVANEDNIDTIVKDIAQNSKDKVDIEKALDILKEKEMEKAEEKIFVERNAKKKSKRI